MSTDELARIENSDRSGYWVGEWFAVLQYGRSWEVRRKALSGSPYGELLNRFKTRREAVEWARVVARNEGKES